jgi:tRNA(Ile)-lysidine synthase
MQDGFAAFCNQYRLFSAQDRVLLAVSGGIDSMCMFHLFRSAGVSMAVAHCHFGLRGEAADADEAFVRQAAAEAGCVCHVQHFDTRSVAEAQGISIQMAARRLRYDWFYELADQYGYTRVAVAHNRDDVLETFLINLGRGTGIRGLTGMAPLQGRLIRPLLFASRAEITGYAQIHRMEWREDASNAEDDYQRNFIRHQLIPCCEEVFPSFRATMDRNMKRFGEADALYAEAVQRYRQELVTHHSGTVRVAIAPLLATPAPGTLLYEIIKPYGFGSAGLDDIMASLSRSVPGKQFLSKSHRLVRDREHLVIHPLQPREEGRYYIEQGQDKISFPVALELRQMPCPEPFVPVRDASVAQLDAALLEYPLLMRRWHKGDYFVPLGMKELVKVSDFFINQKLSLVDKEQQWLLISGQKIVWIIGQRIDDRFKVTAQTRTILGIYTMQ